MREPIFRRGIWWQERDDGTWLRWDDGSGSWERSETPPPPPDDPTMPPIPPTPGMGAASAGTQAAPPDNYLVWAILVTLFCFLPTGIAAIVFSSQVNTKFAAGDYAGAVEASEKARTWTIVSVALGLLFGIIVFGIASSSGGPDFYVAP